MTKKQTIRTIGKTFVLLSSLFLCGLVQRSARGGSDDNRCMGGGTIVPIYGVRGYEDRYIQHLSPQFVEMVSYAAKEADRLGMWVDMTTGTGWPFGGPMITDAYQDVSPVYKNGSFSTRFSGTKVKRAAPGGAGRAVSPYSTEAWRST